MSNPAYLKRLYKVANESIDEDPTIAFMISYILWETIRSRLLLLMCKKLGWSLKNASEETSSIKISNNDDFKKTFKIITKFHFIDILLENCKSCWNYMMDMEKIRNQIFHGGKNIAPKILAEYRRFILAYIQALRFDQQGEIVPGDPFNKEKKNKIVKTKEELSVLLDSFKKVKRMQKLPDINIIKKITKKLLKTH